MALERERCCDIMDTGGKVEDLMASFFTCKLFDVNAVRAVDMFTTLRGKHFSAGNLGEWLLDLLRDFFEKKKKKLSLHHVACFRSCWVQRHCVLVLITPSCCHPYR